MTEDNFNFSIDKHVLIPEKPKRVGYAYKYPFKVMVEGDSFAVFCSEKDKSKIQRRLITAAKFNEGKFITRTVEGGVRIWRIK